MDVVNERIPADWWFIGYDETSHWNLHLLPSDVREYVRRIVTVYAFNRAEHTHCCEITPSHYLMVMDYEPSFSSAFYRLAEAKKEHVHDRISSFTQGAGPRHEGDCYRHVRSVDRHLSNFPGLAYRVGVLEDAEEGEERDALNEMWSANPKFVI